MKCTYFAVFFAGINSSGGGEELSVLNRAKNSRIHISRHYGDVLMGAIASQITSLAIVYSTVYSDADQRKHQSSASLPFVRGIHRGPMNSPYKWPVMRKMFPFDDVIMDLHYSILMLIDSIANSPVEWQISKREHWWAMHPKQSPSLCDFVNQGPIFVSITNRKHEKY